MDLCIRPDELRGVLEEWIRLRERHAGSMDVLWHDCRVGMLVGETERRKYVGCGAGRLVARIRPDGTVTPCVFLPDVVGRVPEQTFDEIWRTSRLMQQFRERDGHVTGNCGGCEHLQSCGGCRAVARAYSAGDPLAGDPHCWIHPGEVPDVPLRRLAAGEGLPV